MYIVLFKAIACILRKIVLFICYYYIKLTNNRHLPIYFIAYVIRPIVPILGSRSFRSLKHVKNLEIVVVFEGMVIITVSVIGIPIICVPLPVSI